MTHQTPAETAERRAKAEGAIEALRAAAEEMHVGIAVGSIPLEVRPAVESWLRRLAEQRLDRSRKETAAPAAVSAAVAPPTNRAAPFGSPDCTCVPFTRKEGMPRACGPDDTVDDISGWETGRDCPHHAPVASPTDPTHGLSVQHADALWDAVAIPGPRTPTYPEQHERVCRAVRNILDELTPARDEEADQTALRDRIADKLTAAAYECNGKCGLSEQECYDAHPINFSAMAGGTTHVDGSVTAIADAVLAELPSAGCLTPEYTDGPCHCPSCDPAAHRTDRAAVLADVERAIRTATRSCGYKAEDGCDFCNGVDAALDQVRRMADETATETQARRGDAFEQWLKARRDEWAPEGCQPWQILDQTLEEYRLHADTGTPLGEHVCEGKAVGDCECLEQPAAGARQDETPDAQTQPATPMTAHLTTPCDACNHTLNWHSSGETGCTVLRCACARYYHAAGQGQDGNQP